MLHAVANFSDRTLGRVVGVVRGVRRAECAGEGRGGIRIDGVEEGCVTWWFLGSEKI